MAGGGEMPQIALAYQHQPDYAPESFRSPTNAPLRKLTVDLIKTYRKINEVRIIMYVYVYVYVYVFVCVCVCLCLCVCMYVCVYD